MKFQFCGGISAPEWFLPATFALTRMTPDRLKTIITIIVKSYQTDNLASSWESIVFTLESGGFDRQQIDGIIASLIFVIENSIRFKISDQVLSKQLGQLGIHRDSAQIIIKALRLNLQTLLFAVEKKRQVRVGDKKKISFTAHRTIYPRQSEFLQVNWEEKGEEEWLRMSKEEGLNLLQDLKKSWDLLNCL